MYNYNLLHLKSLLLLVAVEELNNCPFIPYIRNLITPPSGYIVSFICENNSFTACIYK